MESLALVVVALRSSLNPRVSTVSRSLFARVDRVADLALGLGAAGRGPRPKGRPGAAAAGATGSGSGVSGRASVLGSVRVRVSRGPRARRRRRRRRRRREVLDQGDRAAVRRGAGSITRGGTGGTSSGADSSGALACAEAQAPHRQQQRDDQERTVHVESDRVRRRDTPTLTALVYACGNIRRNRVPRPGVDCTSTSPSCSWTMR